MKILAIAAAGLLLSAATRAEAVSVQGAGATFPAPLYAKWVDAYNKTHPGVEVDYQAIGSGGGIRGITDRILQFAGSDAPMTDAQLKAAPGKILHIPTVAGPVVMIYNLEGVDKLVLDGETIAGIYLGKITLWNDPKIAALNPGVALPEKDILVAHRSDGSGTTWIFTDYLGKASPAWKKNARSATALKWPVGIGGKGNAGVAQAVQSSEGGIGYVELAFAESSEIPFADIKNKAGKVVHASVGSAAAAAKNSAGAWPEDNRISITNAGGDESYPISGFTYFLIYGDMSYMEDKALAAATLDFIHWALDEGQAMAAKGGKFAPLTPEMQGRLVETLKTVRFDGQALLK